MMRRLLGRGGPLLIATWLIATTTTNAAGPTQPANSYDVVVYGTTSAGVIAAVQAAKMDKSVVLVGPDEHIGGLSSSGLGRTDSGRESAIGGLAHEFYHRIWEYYQNPDAWTYQTHQEYLATNYGARAVNESAQTMWCFEPSVAEAVFEGFVKEYDIPIFRDEWLNRKTGVKLKDGRITAITMLSGKTFRGKVFIDATYEGDLMAAAGVSYTVGRESNEKYGEFLNGVQKDENVHNHSFVVEVDPYKIPGDPSSGLVWGVHGGDPGEEGEGDDRVQAYCYRMCMSNVPENSVPFPKPAAYDETIFELLFRNFEAGDMRLPIHPGMMPNGKTDTNNNHAISTDGIGLNYEYPEASYQEREDILALHELYQKGLMWSLANHPRVPQEIRDQMAKWGLAKDEFVENGNWPYQIYVREARRMIGPYVQTELDCRRLRICEDSVGLGSYNMDSHNAQRYITPEGFVQNEGDVQVNPGGTYAISYRALTPKEDEVQNLIVPVCLSSSHIAYGSIRMEPVFMILGQSAATAAVLAIDAGVPVQDVPYSKLKQRLLADGQKLKPEGTPRPPLETLSAESLPGIVIDDTQADLQGGWSSSKSHGLWLERGYRHDGNTRKGQSAATAAAMAIDAGVPVQDVPYSKLKQRLLADGQKLKPKGTPRPPLKTLSAESLPGIVIDDTQADLQGGWSSSKSHGLWLERGYRHDGNTRKGQLSAVYQTQLKPGRYEVRVSYTTSPNRATNVPVTIYHADGTQQTTINERQEPPIDYMFISLGTFPFDDIGKVEIRNDETDGYVIIDAVQFLPKD